ncbi:MAG: DUF447 family protein [Gemmatimonadetes bacterium]|nr:DUF447 family protein [Gemmatimonadota bacterium]
MPFLIESIVTTVDAAGTLNVAPMGVGWEDSDELILQPWRNTTTYRNLAATGEAVVNLTDDVRIFAAAAISNPVFPTRPAAIVAGLVLEAACSWREVRVEEAGGTPERARFRARVVHHGFAREFLGFNRARNAVLEAAILSTRTSLLPPAEIRAGFQRLQIVVDKTAGAAEREAMDLLAAHVRGALGDGV